MGFLDDPGSGPALGTQLDTSLFVCSIRVFKELDQHHMLACMYWFICRCIHLYVSVFVNTCEYVHMAYMGMYTYMGIYICSPL